MAVTLLNELSKKIKMLVQKKKNRNRNKNKNKTHKTNKQANTHAQFIKTKNYIDFYYYNK